MGFDEYVDRNDIPVSTVQEENNGDQQKYFYSKSCRVNGRKNLGLNCLKAHDYVLKKLMHNIICLCFNNVQNKILNFKNLASEQVIT